MKKRLLMPAILLLLGWVATAGALELDISSLSESALYKLYAQAEAQLHLNALNRPSDYEEVSAYRIFEQDPAGRANQKIRFTGIVTQVVEGANGYAVYRIARNGKESQMFYLEYTRPSGASRLLEGDEVTVYAVFRAMKTYRTTTGQEVTVPYGTADLIIPPVTRASLRKAEDAELADALEQIDRRLEQLRTADDQGGVWLHEKQYTEYARRPAKYQDQKITVTGTVTQFSQEEAFDSLQIALDGKEACVLHVRIHRDNLTIRLRNGDEITASGVFHGLYTYKDPLEGSVTIPSAILTAYTVKGYEASQAPRMDEEGYCWITKDSFEEYARNPEAHMLELIRFSGWIIQAAEGTDGEWRYRVAVDSDLDCVFYVEYAAPADEPALQKDDQALLSGAFCGLFTYSTAQGDAITVPAAIAVGMEKSYQTLKEGSAGNDVHAMKIRMQELGYFTQGVSLSLQYNSICTERVKLFQQVNGLEQTGVADAQTQLLLFSENAQANPHPK